MEVMVLFGSVAWTNSLSIKMPVGWRYSLPLGALRFTGRAVMAAVNGSVAVYGSWMMTGDRETRLTDVGVPYKVSLMLPNPA